MKYWLIEFNDVLSGQGYLELDEHMNGIAVYTSSGILATGNFGYKTIETENVTPPWVK